MRIVLIALVLCVLNNLTNTGLSKKTKKKVNDEEDFNLFDFLDLGQGKKLISDHLIPDKDDDFCYFECPKNSKLTLDNYRSIINVAA
jgi:hypothetical protein